MHGSAILSRPAKPVLARRGIWFLVALLFALASALVPALVPSGGNPPRHLGSAFDPSNNVLALRARAHQNVVAVVPSNERDASLADGASAGDQVLPPQILALWIPAYPASSLPPADRVREALPRLRSPVQPRAPPPVEA